MSATHIIDFGPGTSTARRSHRMFAGSGVAVIVAFKDNRGSGGAYYGNSALFSPDETVYGTSSPCAHPRHALPIRLQIAQRLGYELRVTRDLSLARLIRNLVSQSPISSIDPVQLIPLAFNTPG